MPYNPFSVTGVKPGFNSHEENGVSAFENFYGGKGNDYVLGTAGAVLERERRNQPMPPR